MDKVFRVNYIFTKEMITTETLVNDLFEIAIGQLDWLRQITENRDIKYSNDDIYLEFNKIVKNELLKAKETAKAQDVENGINFSFDIPVYSEKFEEVDENGCRKWLRQYINDTFVNYVRGGLMDKQMKYVIKHGKEIPSDNKYVVLLKALESSVSSAYKQKEVTFWIDGE